ncbi:hypothetical protein E1182_29500, partial [Micromonospora sp. KC721]
MSVSSSSTATTARLLPGGPVADRVLAEVAEGVAELRAAGVTPALATVLVGEDDASAGYIRIKQRQAALLGFASPHVHLPGSASQADLEAVLADFTADRGVHGVLVQHPVPGHLDYDRAVQVLDPDKDVDGMHPVNMGRLALGLPGPLPCTPAGIEALLAFHGVPVAGREVVILGRGATLGRPLAMLLAQKRPTANAAVTVVHTGVADWPRYTRRAEILVAAAGVPVTVADNVLPRIGVLAPASARAAIRGVFLRHVIGGKRLSRGGRFARLVRAATPDAVLTGVEVLADTVGGDLVVVDVGGATTDVYSV